MIKLTSKIIGLVVLLVLIVLAIVYFAIEKKENNQNPYFDDTKDLITPPDYIDDFCLTHQCKG